MFNQREYKILILLMENGEIFSIEQLAKNFSISERTIRYDLDEIDYFLKYSNFPMLTRKQNLGVSYQVDNSLREQLLLSLSEYIKAFSALSTDERILEMVVKLATAKEPLKLETECELMSVSKSTMFKDFEKVRELFFGKDIVVEGSKRGYLLLGNEIHICFRVAKVVLSFLNSDEIIDIMQFLIFGNKKIKNSLATIFEDENLEKIMHLIKELQGSSNLGDENYLFAIFSLAIAYKRGIDCEKGTMFFLALGNILKSIKFNQCVNDTEKLAITLISLVEKEAGISFQNDQILHGAVKLELQYILSKLGHLNFETEEMNKLLSSNHQLVIAIEKATQSVAKRINSKQSFTKDDVFKLLIHFVEALDRKLYFGISQPKVAVLSPFNRSISTMIEERILSYFDIEIVAVGDLREIAEVIKGGDVDFVISTLQIYFDNVITIVVNPLISNIDIANLKRILPTRVVDVMLLKEIYEFSKSYVTGEKQKEYITGMQNILNIKTRENIEADENGI